MLSLCNHVVRKYYASACEESSNRRIIDFVGRSKNLEVMPNSQSTVRIIIRRRQCSPSAESCLSCDRQVSQKERSEKSSDAESQRAHTKSSHADPGPWMQSELVCVLTRKIFKVQGLGGPDI